MTGGRNHAIVTFMTDRIFRRLAATKCPPPNKLNGTGDLSLSGRNRKRSPFLALSAGLLLFAAVVGAVFIILRPTTLRIACRAGGKHDQHLIQALAQRFAHDGDTVRLSVHRHGRRGEKPCRVRRRRQGRSRGCED